MSSKFVAFLVNQESRNDRLRMCFSALVADIPDDGQIGSLNFQGPYRMNPSKSTDDPANFRMATPVYNYQKDELHWASTNSDSVTAWRIGKYFTVNAVDSTALPNPAWVTPRIILDEGIASVGLAGLLKPKLARRVRESEPWTALPFNTVDESQYGFKDPRTIQRGLFFRPPRDELRYIYMIRALGDKTGTYLVDVIPSKQYAELKEGSTIQWQRYTFSMGTPVAGNFAVAVLTDNSTGKPRLYFFDVGPDQWTVHYAYIPLRKDGSINSTESQIKGAGCGQFRNTRSDKWGGVASVLEHGGNLLASIEMPATGEGWIAPKQTPFFCFTAPLKADGSPADQKDWKEVQVTKPDVIQINGNRPSYAFAILPSDFCD